MQTFNLNFDNAEGLISHREGDWIIFTNPKYPKFQKRYNWKTRKVITIGAETLPEGIILSGSHAPVVPKEEFESN